MTGTAAIVGAGILGRLLALKLWREGWKVTLFEARKDEGGNTSSVAAGMLSPTANWNPPMRGFAGWGSRL